MIKFILFILFLISFSNADDIYMAPAFKDNNQENKVLSEEEILMTNKSVLNDAIKHKDYDTVAKIAISYYFNAQNPAFVGNREKLKKKALELLEYCVDNGDAKSALFLIVRFQKENPKYAMSIAEKIIDQGKIGKYTSIPLIYASLVLDNTPNNKENINRAIDGLFSVQESASTNFYAAFLFKSLGNEMFANMYLNNACHMAKPNTNIYRYCTDPGFVEKIDNLESRVIKKNCSADIGRRCK